MFCLFMQKAAYEVRMIDLSSEVCSSDLGQRQPGPGSRRSADHKPQAPARGAAAHQSGLMAVDIRIATRKSELALWQANHVATRLSELPETIGSESCTEKVCQ